MQLRPARDDCGSWHVRRPGPFAVTYWLLSNTVTNLFDAFLGGTLHVWSLFPGARHDGYVGMLDVTEGERVVAPGLRGFRWVLEVTVDGLVLATVTTGSRTPIVLPHPVAVVVRPRYGVRRSRLAHTPWRARLTLPSDKVVELVGPWFVLCHAARTLAWPSPTTAR
ncbi:MULTISPECIES: hypothetical protein [Aeromicrobium]|uniref:Uncharacterized protein n=1 Tax=Aeromicrobium erythreum TaxID=2041 RepID=A0A0U4BAR2_9ACTN|nr:MULTISPECIES: hypothetical protein [Aeromicrobium]ALX04969.1 hypothetical protein AERYTH_09780 [Aeromicrobium erythreum]